MSKEIFIPLKGALGVIVDSGDLYNAACKFYCEWEAVDDDSQRCGAPATGVYYVEDEGPIAVCVNHTTWHMIPVVFIAQAIRMMSGSEDRYVTHSVQYGVRHRYAEGVVACNDREDAEGRSAEYRVTLLERTVMQLNGKPWYSDWREVKK